MINPQLSQQVAGRALTFVGAEAIDAKEFKTSDLLIERISKALTFYASSQKEPGWERCAIFIEFGVFTALMPEMIEFALVKKDLGVLNNGVPGADFTFARTTQEGVIFNYSGYTFAGSPIFIIPRDFAGRLDLVVGDLWCFTERWYAPAITAYRGRTEEEELAFQEAAELAEAAKKEAAAAEHEHEKAERIGEAEAEKRPDLELELAGKAEVSREELMDLKDIPAAPKQTDA